MKLHEEHVDISTPDGTMETFVARPGGDEASPAIVLYMDAPGIREELREFARRIAREGYYCLLPDMYYRSGRVRYDLATMTAEQGKEMFGHMRSITNELVMRDTEGLLAHVAKDPAASDGPKGCIGYCMSGQYVMSAVGTFPDDFQAGVSCYGVAIITDKKDSPHLLAGRVEAELFFAFAEHDEYVPDGLIEKLRATLDEHGVAHQTDVYPGTHHGFCFPERKGMYAEAAAEDVWKRSFELFARRLR